eukprot:TRINITY_DN2992_c0_g2_i1.p1 TRINITY_DN2992_c0_g2~~TRINITY_DN2992_c0_g2_i1.p1  ORF type:complete len:154 (+),score=0.18 TRINITY_DN2992_c0_g2_i1:483-944(+)
MINYVIYCDSFWKIFYIAFISLVATIGIILSSSQRFRTPRFQALRASMFIIMGLGSVWTSPHWLYLVNFWDMIPMITQLALMGGAYILGATIYALKIPERWFPGQFDYWWNSHMIFHLLGIVATWFMYTSIYTAHEWHFENRIYECQDTVNPL